MTKIDDETASLVLAHIREKLSDSHVKKAERFEIWDQLHALAESRYKAAIDLFVEGLGDTNSAWRFAYLADLGFHYDVEDLRPHVERIRALLLGDPDEDVRRAAASIIGRIASWPDTALLHALAHDPETAVRDASFEALLLQLGFPLPDLRTLRHTLVLQGKEATIETLEEISKQYGHNLE